MRRIGTIAITAVLLSCAGCGSTTSTEYANRLVGAEGQQITLEDVEAIVDDADLTDDEKRQRLHDLGIQDEKLIEAVLSL